MIGPRMGATRVVMAQIPVAAGASLGGKTRSKRVCDSGINGPPHRPCRTRNMTSIGRDVAVPHRNENSPKPSMLATNTLTEPNRPASQPVRGTVIASATE